MRSNTPLAMRSVGRACLGLVTLIFAGPHGATAQRIWSGSFYPTAYYSTVDGLWGAVHFGMTSPIGFAERPEPQAGRLGFHAGASTSGSYSVMADAGLPAYWDGWRLRASLAATRDNRLGFYGIGNETPYSADSVTPFAPFYYRVSRSREYGRLTIQRRIIGPLRVLLGGVIERTSFRPLPGPSVFRLDSIPAPFVDNVVRTGLVVDTRDNELDPHSGIFAQALFASGSGYTRTTGDARVFLTPLHRVVIAGRIAGEGTSGSPPVAVQLQMESSENSFIAVGGYHSLRGFYDARFIGPGKLLGGLEARYSLVWAPTVVEVVLGGFYDVGRVFGPGEPFAITTTGLHHSGGGEVALRFLRNALLVLGVGACEEGAQLLFAGSWSY